MSSDSSASSPRPRPPKSLQQQLFSLLFALLLLVPLGVLYRTFSWKRPSVDFVEQDGVWVGPTNYNGWAGAFVIANNQVEVIVVPAVGRVMRFGFRGEPGPFWENAQKLGGTPDPKAPEWGNFGGDKTWPAPQSDWPRVTPRGWPPPAAFDSMPVSSEIKGNRVILRSQTDPHYHIRTEREITLTPTEPRMTIVTTYERLVPSPGEGGASSTNHVGVWIITQLQHPVGVFIPVPSPSIFPEGYSRQSDALPLGLKKTSDYLSLTRDPHVAHKIGTDASRLLWVGDRVALRIDSPRLPDGTYPDRGSSAEVYTNPDPLAYVELEMLGPLTELPPSGRTSQTNVYTLFRRQGSAIEAEVQLLLGK